MYTINLFINLMYIQTLNKLNNYNYKVNNIKKCMGIELYSNILLYIYIL